MRFKEVFRIGAFLVPLSRGVGLFLREIFWFGTMSVAVISDPGESGDT